MNYSDPGEALFIVVLNIVVIVAFMGILYAIRWVLSKKLQNNTSKLSQSSVCQNQTTPSVVNESTDTAGIIIEDVSDSQTRYEYRAKDAIMTPTEERVYRRLVEVFERKFYIIPQVHLSTILDYRVKGQNWYGAFQHINRKSVDYILLNKNTLKPICAVELDDYTHKFDKRRRRDNEVERIFRVANMPLVRIHDIARLSNSEIIELFARIINS